MKRTNMMKTALLSTVAVANIFACASAFAAEETTTAAPAVAETTTTETTTAPATETKAETTAPAPVVAPVAGTTYRIDEGTYVEIRNVYGNPVVIQVPTTAPGFTQTTAIDIFGGSAHTINSVRNDNRN